MRVVLDTSVIVAGLRSRRGASRLWLESLLERKHTMLLSVPLVLQYEEVLLRPENLAVFGLTAMEIDRLLDAYCAIAEPVELTYLWRPLLRDPDAEMVLETAVVGRSDMLLTFNIRDFAGAERVGVEVVEPGPAWRRAQGA
jgi:putative PIN family toxin of toxin-antitoxin system